MTDEELKEKLLATKPDDQWAAGWGATVPINPDGEAAWNRIEELEAEDAVKEMFYKNRIEELEAWKLAVDHQLVSAGCNTADSYSTPAKALDALIKQEIALANDPLINEETDALEKGTDDEN